MIFNYIKFWFENLMAGAWNYVWHWGTAGFIIAACLALFFGVDYLLAVPIVRIFVEPLKKYRIDLLWVAVAAGVYMAGLATGDRDAAARCKAQQVVVEREVKVIVHEAAKEKEAAKKAKRPMKDPYATSKKKEYPRYIPKHSFAKPPEEDYRDNSEY